MQTTNSSEEEDGFQVRKLEISDKNKGFLELLQQLTVCDPVSDETFKDRFELTGDDWLVAVIEDKNSGRIIATASLFIEKKFIRSCGKAGHIEDVVVDSSFRGKQLGKKIIEFLADHARATGCYKVILDCGVKNKPFYEKCGLEQGGVQMVKYFVLILLHTIIICLYDIEHLLLALMYSILRIVHNYKIWRIFREIL